MVSSNFARAVCLTSFTAVAKSWTGPALCARSAAARYFLPCCIRPPWFRRDGRRPSLPRGQSLETNGRRAIPRGPIHPSGACGSGRPKLLAFLFDGLQLGFRGVAFLHHPVELLEEGV